MRTPPERGTRDRILEVAEESLGDSGYHGTRLHHIAERVGIQKASLFHYFPSKEELYRAVLEEGVGETEDTLRRVLSLEKPPYEKVRWLLSAYVDMVAQHPQRTKILLRQSLGDAPDGLDEHHENSQRLLSAVVKFISDGQKAGIFAPVDPTALVLDVIGVVAFLFTSAPVLAPNWLRDVSANARVERIKAHVIDIVERCLTAAADVTPRATTA